MTTRDVFLAKVRASQPASRPRPEVPLFASPGGDLRERFSAALTVMGGTLVDVESGAEVRQLIDARFGADAVICSATPEVQGTRVLTAHTAPASLEDVDVGVVRADTGWPKRARCG